MYTAKALAHFGKGHPESKHRALLAAAAGVKKQSVAHWVQIGYVPLKSAQVLAAKSRGRCKVDLDAYKPGVPDVTG